ncbi:MAG: SRPBCC family protein [Lautropia sp.]
MSSLPALRMLSPTIASHTITIALPVRQCQMLFTPAGETLWVAGWAPRYLHPSDGTTTPGMVFMTGTGEDTTVWTLTHFSASPHHARYARVTPASHWGFVDIACDPVQAKRTRVTVTYAMQATCASDPTLPAHYAPDAFAAMIDGWKRRIDERLDALRDARIG